MGRSIAMELSRHDARVILLGRDEKRLAEATASLKGGGHLWLSLDLVNHESIAPAIQKLRSEAGPIYGLCHAAGVVETRPLSANRAEVLRAVLDVNVVGGLELARVVCRRDVLEPDGGSILFVSSVYGRVGMPSQISYSASKSALYGAVRSMAVELARRKIRVNSISPGLVWTEMTRKAMASLTPEQVKNIEGKHPLGAGAPEDVATAAVFLLSPVARWITGTDLAIDGGFSAQ
jgi:NAD(P)-dependent dehydrogenase (short-subunit alcohol dehydrogenase family)